MYNFYQFYIEDQTKHNLVMENTQEKTYINIWQLFRTKNMMGTWAQVFLKSIKSINSIKIIVSILLLNEKSIFRSFKRTDHLILRKKNNFAKKFIAPPPPLSPFPLKLNRWSLRSKPPHIISS